MQLVVLNVLVASSNHLHKIMLSPGLGAYAKGHDMLPEWLKVAAGRQEATPGSVVEMTLNWDDDNNAIFKFGTNSDAARKFRSSARGKWMSKIPKFRSIIIDDANDNLSSTAYEYSPLGIMLGVIQQSFDDRALECFGARWTTSHREQTHLYGSKPWDDRWTEIFAFELQFTSSYRKEFFSEKANLMTMHNLMAKASG